MSVKISELPVLAPEDVAAGDVVAIVDISEGVTKQVDLAGVLAGGGSGDPFETKAIAEPFPVWDHITGAPVPDNSGAAKFIRLTAGQSSVGGYNEGLLTDEQVSGSAPLVVADAEIMVGPMAGGRVALVNTEMSFMRGGTSSGTLQFDQMQRITGHIDSVASAANFASISGALSRSPGGFAGASASGESSRIALNSANSPSARASASTDGETRSKNRQVTYYMRIA